MKIKQAGLVLTVVAAALMLLTTYLAVMYAPIPGTGVKVANEMLSSVADTGIGIKVSGFVTNKTTKWPEGLDVPTVITFSLADFADFQRYVVASEEDISTGSWWTIRPIDVKISVGGLLLGQGGSSIVGTLTNGTNVSVSGVVQTTVIGPNSAVTGYSIYASSTNSLETGPAGGFSTMTAPIAQKIFYFHMPSAWVSYVAFFVTLVGSILYLRSRDLRYDRLAMSSAELGVLFATIAIATGPIWAKEEWGVYWRWDDTKLVTTFVMWLVYIGYLSLRAAISEPTLRARVSSVYGIIGFVTMPMSLLSSRIAPLLRSSHPEVIASSSGSLSSEAGIAVGVAVVTFTIMYVAMLIKRAEIAGSEEELEELKRAVGGEE